MREPVQVVVLGAGPGGYTAAFLAAGQGLSTVLVDTDQHPGGVCLHRGCIPSKALLHLAKVLTEARDAENMGLSFSKPVLDLDRMRAWKEGVVQRLTQGLGAQCARRGVTFVQGKGRFLDHHTLEVERSGGDREPIAFQHAILASGSRPSGIPGLDLNQPGILNATQALALDTIPRTLLVVGGGNIGMELGTVYAALGSQVSLVEMTQALLPGVDRDLIRPVVQRLTHIMASIQTNTRITTLQAVAGGVRAAWQTGDAHTEKIFEQILVATGRQPNSENLGLEAVGVRMEKGFVQVGPDKRTSVPNLLAIGDVIGGPLLAHKAAHDARVAVSTLMGNPPPPPKIIPFVTYTDPELACAGLTETEARKQGIPVRAVRFPWAASGRAHTMGRTDGLTKWIVDPSSERILGVGITGPHAGELLAQGVLAMEQKLTIRDMAAIIHPHPTLSETLLEAAETFSGESVHYHVPKRDRPVRT